MLSSLHQDTGRESEVTQTLDLAKQLNFQLHGIYQTVVRSFNRRFYGSAVNLSDKFLALQTTIGLFCLLTLSIVILYIVKRKSDTELALTRFRMDESLSVLTDAVVVYDAGDKIIFCNHRFLVLSGVPDRSQVIGQTFESFCQAVNSLKLLISINDDGSSVQERRKKFHRTAENFDMKTSYGTTFRVTQNRTEEGGLVCTYTNISDLKSAEEKLQYFAKYDSLTGLLRRRLFLDEVNQKLLSKDTTSIAVLYVDLDHFKRINDTNGHSAGDSVLQEVAARLVAVLGETATICRQGGDEFIAMMTIESMADGERIGHSIRDVVLEPVNLGGPMIFVSVSIGVACYPEHATTTSELIRYADIACIAAKRRGRDAVYLLDNFTVHEEATLNRLEAELDSALDENELFLEYQPQLDLLSGKIAGFEALIRWRHPELGVINPGQFIGIAEDSGQIQSIGAWVIEKACIDLRYLSDNGFDGFRMSINLSPRQLYQADFADTLINAIVRYQVPASSVVLEITESAIMDNAERGIEALNSLSSLGVSIAIDDFGTGYSSLVALKQYPIDRIKIDQLFVSRLTEKGDDLEIINAVINMAHNLRLSVVAEGVETKSQLEMLTALGCDEIQGFLLGKPLALDAIFEFLKGDEWQESLVL